MTQLIPGTWLRAQSESIEQLFNMTRRCCDTVGHITELNLHAVRFALAQSEEAFVRACAAGSLPELLCLPTLLGSADFSEALSYGKQYWKILSDLEPDAVPSVPARLAAQRPHLLSDR
ncbi:hypothetical protein LMG22037_00074 [Paraburkholderia phenoliruptrix]|uniref:Phasin domain-containing protein n=1 Tax=Paraburkholderia phenoliruptrix TaxID=252970 RepID=A0A6J4ZX78_9BURK|nr:TIGR01841 family phasin [Paraburkholderia phenoliruptrix]CAB3638541.1 hypothetical protein LMG22037_00074 [Paraburkholderia phenoliruptrix]